MFGRGIEVGCGVGLGDVVGVAVIDGLGVAEPLGLALGVAKTDAVGTGVPVANGSAALAEGAASAAHTNATGMVSDHCLLFDLELFSRLGLTTFKA